MNLPRTYRLVAFALVCALALTVHAAESRTEQTQKGIRKKAKGTLQRLHRAILGQWELAASNGQCSSWPLPHIEKAK